jgi:hypothetical protein
MLPHLSDSYLAQAPPMSSPWLPYCRVLMRWTYYSFRGGRIDTWQAGKNLGTPQPQKDIITLTESFSNQDSTKPK